MTVFDLLKFIGGVATFIFGMNYMGSALEKKAGGRLSSLLSRFTSNKYTGFLLGLIVTVVIHSSAATTVMVVGFVNSGILTLSQSVGVIIGSNVGTTATSWILSLTGIDGDNFFINMLKPSSFTPIVALIGVILYVFVKKSKSRDLGMILIGFSLLMFGMQTASDAVSGLSEVPGFAKMFVLFKNPILGMIAGALVTALLQSSAASVGILQALCATGQVSVSAALPIILGQNIGTCITAMISSIGANKNARRAATIHLNFNLLGSILVLVLFYGSNVFLHYSFVDESATSFHIAVIHTFCNLVTTAVFLPLSSFLEKLSCKMVRDKPGDVQEEIILDERFFVNPGVALEQGREKVSQMAQSAAQAFEEASQLLFGYDEGKAQDIRKQEARLDKYEDVISSYFVKLNSKELSASDSEELTKLLRVTGVFERVSDHAVHIVIHTKALDEKGYSFSQQALHELSVLAEATAETIRMTTTAFCTNDFELATQVESIEQVVDKLTKKIRNNHIERVLKGECSFDIGLVFTDIVSVFERVSDHCSEIAASMIEIERGNLDVHEYLHEFKSKDNPEFIRKYTQFKEKYTL